MSKATSKEKKPSVDQEYAIQQNKALHWLDKNKIN